MLVSEYQSLKSNLNGGNIIKAMGRVFDEVQCSIVEWTKEDLDVKDRRTRKLMTMNEVPVTFEKRTAKKILP